MKVVETQAGSRLALADSNAFAQLPADLIDRVFARMSEYVFEPNETIIRQGEHGDSLMVVLEGSARIVLRDGDNVRPITSVGSDEVFGEMALVTEGPRSADVIADGRVRVLRLPADAFQELAYRHPELGVVITSLVANRLGEQGVDGMGGKEVGGYRIHRSVGRGGMAVVYEAYGEEGRVALKMMSHRLLYEPGAMARFEREATTLRKLRHENIASVYRCFSAFRTSFFAMEYCDGPVLADFIARHGAVDEATARALIGQVAAALHYMHGEGVIHRDLKPTNLMLTGAGQVKLTDFGLAKPIGVMQQAPITHAPMLLGTPLYMAPEQLACEECNAAADIYGLGCVALELLSGQPPFAATTFLELAREKLSYILPLASEIGAGVSAEMFAFIESCMSQDPRDRDVDLAAIAGWGRLLDPQLLSPWNEAKPGT
jgi:hypothetical protein